MNIDIYCDESLHDLFTSKKSKDKYMFIGSLWIDREIRDEIKLKVKELRVKHNCWGEIKWTKVTPSKRDFYIELINLFFSYGMQMRFRCIMVEAKKMIWTYHKEDKELGFYKFYYQLLHKWIKDFNKYKIFFDMKKNRDLTRLRVLRDILTNQYQNSYIEQIQALPSKEVVLIQLTDLLLGATSAKLNDKIISNQAKKDVISHIEKLRAKEIAPTYQIENKFNIFKIKLSGGL